MAMPKMRRIGVPKIRREGTKASPEVKKGAEEELHVESLTLGDLTWVNIQNPTEREREYLAQHFPFHPLNLDDVLSRIQRPKIDAYKDHLFIVLHFPVYSKVGQTMTSSEMDIFIGENYVVTVDCAGNLKTLNKFFALCQADEEVQQKSFSQGSGYLLYRIVDRMVDYYFPILNKIGALVERVEDDIFSRSRVPKAIEALSILRREVISFRRIIWPVRAVIGSLEPKIRRFTKMDMADYFGDIIDHLDKIWDGLDEYKDVIEGLNATYDSLATNRTNEVVRTLTTIAAILLPLTVIASVYGMNIPLPFQESPYSFILVFFIWAVIVSGMLYFFRRKRWI